jgi:hypothetical protein
MATRSTSKLTFLYFMEAVPDDRLLGFSYGWSRFAGSIRNFTAQWKYPTPATAKPLGTKIDKVIAEALAREALADARARRAAWREVAERAAAAKSLPK